MPRAVPSDGDLGGRVATAQGVGHGQRRLDVAGRPPPARTTRRGAVDRTALAHAAAGDLRPRRRIPARATSGAGPVPARARPAPRGARFVACEGDEHPERDQGRQQRRAAVGDQRQRQAGDRQQPEHRTDVDQGLAGDPGGRAGRGEPAEQVPNAARCAGRVHEEGEQDQHRDVPISPSSSPMTAKMKSCAPPAGRPTSPGRRPGPGPTSRRCRARTARAPPASRHRGSPSPGSSQDRNRSSRCGAVTDSSVTATTIPAPISANSRAGAPTTNSTAEDDRRPAPCRCPGRCRP